MRISEDKATQISHVVFKALAQHGAVKLTADDTKVRRELRQVILRRMKKEDEIEETVRKKIQSYSRNVVEGSSEWDVLYHKHYQEELNRRGKS